MKKERQRSNFPTYDFKDGMITTKLSGDTIIKECKKIVKVPRYANRVFNPFILGLMHTLLRYEKYNKAIGMKVIPTCDNEIAIINSYLITGIIDDSYNKVTANPCFFTDELKQEIRRLWKETKSQQKKTKM